MFGFFKFRKWFIIAMAALAVITAATAFSISYAKWTTSGNQLITDGKTGTWAEVNPGYEIIFSDGTSEVLGKNEYSGIYSASFTVGLSDSAKLFNIDGKTEGFTDIINTYTDSNDGDSKLCITNGTADYKYQTNGAGLYTVSINTDTKTVSFAFIQATATSYIHEIELEGHSSIPFIKSTADANTYAITFAVDGDKSFNIIQNGTFIDLEKASLISKDDCVTDTGASNGYIFKTQKGAAIYTVVIVLSLDNESKLISSTITFSCAELTSTTDNNQAFKDAVNSPAKMGALLGGSYYGIVTSNMEVIPFDTTAKESNYFTIEAGNVFAILISNKRINSSYYTELSIPVEGISPNPNVLAGSNTHLYMATKTGTFYVTYETYESETPSGIAIKSINRIEFKDAIGTITVDSKAVNQNSATLEKSSDGAYIAEFTIGDITKSNFNVYLNAAISQTLTIDSDSEKYITAEGTADGYAFKFTQTGTYKAVIANGIISVTSSSESAAEVSVGVENNGEAKVRINNTLNLVAIVKNAQGKELPITGKTVTWAVSDTYVATVNESGVLTGKSTGTVTVTATVDGLTSAEYTVVVLEQEKVQSVVISGAKTAEIGGNVTLTAIVKGEDGTVLTGRTVTWSSSDTAIATVDKGKVTGKNLGTVSISATVEGKTAVVTITVIDAVSSVTVSGANTLSVGESITLKATVVGKSGNTLTDRTVTWSIRSGSNYAAIDANGVLTGKKAGTVKVRATVDGTNSSDFTVTVTEKVTLSSVSINGETSVVEGEGNSVTLTATANGSGSDITSVSTITWAIKQADSAKATITDGVVTLTANAKAGETITVTVTAEYDGVTKTAEYTVTVVAKETVDSIEIKGASEVTVGGGINLTATVIGTYGNELGDASVTWSVDDTSIATITEDGGVLTGVKAGTVTVTATATYDGVTKTATHIVTVKAVEQSNTQKVIMYFNSSAAPVVEAYVNGSWETNNNLVTEAKTAKGTDAASKFGIDLSYDNGTADAADNKTVTTALKYESATTLTFTLKQSATVTVYYLYRTDKDVSVATLKDSTADKSIELAGTNSERGTLKSAVIKLDSGNYTFARSSGGEVEICYIIFETEGSGTTTPPVTDPISETFDISGAISANAVLAELKVGETSLAKVTTSCAWTSKTGGVIETENNIAHSLAGAKGDIISLELASQYTYTITLYCGSNSSGKTIDLTLKKEGATVATAISGENTTLSACEFKDISAGSYTINFGNSSSARLGRIVITATPIQ